MNENLADEIRKTIESIKDMKTQVSGLNNYLSILEGMVRADIQKKVDEAYQRGINDGSLDAKQRVEGAYQRGLEDGKGAIHKGCEGCRYSGTPQGDSPCFNCSNYYPNNWNKQDDNIEVGDEVRSTYGGKVMEDFTPWVVTLITSETCYGFDADGKPRNNPNTMVQKTGRHFDIDKILRERME